MIRTRVRHRRGALAIVVALVGAAWAGPIARGLSEEAMPAGSASYVVREGDTLWSIAERLRPGQDPRPLVDALVASNGVDPGSLVPGRALVIPSG